MSCRRRILPSGSGDRERLHDERGDGFDGPVYYIRMIFDDGQHLASNTIVQGPDVRPRLSVWSRRTFRPDGSRGSPYTDIYGNLRITVEDYLSFHEGVV